jgi:hypothetical protein
MASGKAALQTIGNTMKLTGVRNPSNNAKYTTSTAPKIAPHKNSVLSSKGTEIKAETKLLQQVRSENTLQVDPKSQRLHAASTPGLNSYAAAYRKYLAVSLAA